MSRYYSILRPCDLGTFPTPPDNEPTKIINFGQRLYVKAIDRDAWGFIEYRKPLTAEQTAQYELIRWDGPKTKTENDAKISKKR